VLIDYDGVRLCLRTAATNGPIVHPPGDMWACRAMVVIIIIPAGDNFWLVHRSLLQSCHQRHLGQVGGMDEGVRILSIQYLRWLKRSLTWRKILRRGTFGFTSHPKEGVLRIFIALKNQSPRPGLNLPPSGPMASTITTTLPMRIGPLVAAVQRCNRTKSTWWSSSLSSSNPLSVYCYCLNKNTIYQPLTL
jgi:hypothetical protein